MDQERAEEPLVSELSAEGQSSNGGGLSRRQALKYAAWGAGSVAAGGGLCWYLKHQAAAMTASEVFKNDAPDETLWQQWQRQGWVREGLFYRRLGRNVQCRMCPNECLLSPGDRGRCRNRVNKDGTLYTLAYGNACSLHVDPIEKKPLSHFIPSTGTFSFASSGCGFRCLNCQNWDISQRKPEETKDGSGEPLRLNPEMLQRISRQAMNRLSLFPEDIVALAEHLHCPSVSYTYSEPTVWLEYMLDTARLARQKSIKNVWVTCGYIQQDSLRELCRYLDAAIVNLKSFSDEIYRDLNSGRLEPVLETLKTLKRERVWFEVLNLLVPTYTDKPPMIRQMCRWLVDTFGSDVVLHFSRFHPAHKLQHLPSTPVETLCEAREIARESGLRYVYLGNTQEPQDAETTFCPQCHRALVQRQGFAARMLNMHNGKCLSCGTVIPGVWSV